MIEMNGVKKKEEEKKKKDGSGLPYVFTTKHLTVTP